MAHQPPLSRQMDRHPRLLLGGSKLLAEKTKEKKKKEEDVKLIEAGKRSELKGIQLVYQDTLSDKQTKPSILFLLLLASTIGSCLQFASAVELDNSVVRVRVGALLEDSDHEQANVFIRTIKMINERRDETIRLLLNDSSLTFGGRPTEEEETSSSSFISNSTNKKLPLNRRLEFQSNRKMQEKNIRLEPMIEFLSDRRNSFEADSKVCQLIEAGVHSVLGPTDGASIQHVQSICDNMELPYFELRPFLGSAPSLLPVPSSLAEQQQQIKENSYGSAGSSLPVSSSRLEELTLNLYPPAHLLNSAYIDLITTWNWSSFAIVYEEGSSMIKFQDLFKESSRSWTNRWQIKLFQFEPNQQLEVNNNLSRSSATLDSGAISSSTSGQVGVKRRRSSFRDIFWRIKTSGERNILLDVKTEHLYQALKQAQQVGCFTESFNYLITSLDLHTIDLEDFKYSRTRITALSLIQVSRYSSSPLIEKVPTFDEHYLEKLGIHVIPQSDLPIRAQRPLVTTAASNNGEIAGDRRHKLPMKYRLSPSVVLERSGSFMDPPSEVYKDWSRRELLQSTPASMSLLPSLDRDKEQRLFEFFVEQQDRNLSRIRLSTSSAIIHDSLLLLSLGLKELDPGGLFIGQEQSIGCSLESQPWLHGSSLVNYMRQVSFIGLTGQIAFDQRGLRADFKLDVMSVAPDIGLIKVGEWHSKRFVEGQLRHAASLKRKQPIEVIDLTNIDSSSNNSTILNSLEMEANSIKSYDEISQVYERELEKYEKLVESGVKIDIPYTKEVSKHGALLVNEFIFKRLYQELVDQVDTLIVTTKLSQPYFMLKETPDKLEGNDQYEGFAVDLIHELSKLVNFKYRWREVADKKYGSKQTLPNGTVVWNGMIGEIIRGQADLAIVDLTITAQRGEAVDFTLPFMNTGISILFKKPTTKVTTLFSFLSPFSSDVWAYVLAAYCGISAVLFLVGHLSPYEWADPHPCRHTAALCSDSSNWQDDHQSETFPYMNSKANHHSAPLLENQFSLLNSFWFTIGSLMQQGSDLTPRSMSTRTIAGIWYFFTLIMISSYTANLAAFLTVEKVVYPIENVRDLSNQDEIKYGCVESGSTCTFFHDSQIDTYKRINETMHKFKTYVRSNDEGQKRVEKGKFAFLMESTSIEYIIERNCNLTQIGGLLDNKGYGVATSKRSRLKRPYRTLLSEGILHLQETGMLHILKNRWWKERRGGGTCNDDGKGGGVTELSLANVGGVFVVLLGGLGISFLVAIAEFMWRARRTGSTRDRMCEDMMNDLRFALACKSSMKPVAGRSNREQQPPIERLVRQENGGQSLPNGDIYAGLALGRELSAETEWQSEERVQEEEEYEDEVWFRVAQQQQEQQQQQQEVRFPYQLQEDERRFELQMQMEQGSSGKRPILMEGVLAAMLFQQQQQQQQQQPAVEEEAARRRCARGKLAARRRLLLASGQTIDNTGTPPDDSSTLTR